MSGLAGLVIKDEHGTPIEIPENLSASACLVAFALGYPANEKIDLTGPKPTPRFDSRSLGKTKP